MGIGDKGKVDCNTRAHWISFWICLGVSIFLMVGSALVPPPFVIDSSIFKAVAYLLAFGALSQVPALVNSGKTARLQHGQTSLTVGDNVEDGIVEDQDQES